MSIERNIVRGKGNCPECYGFGEIEEDLYVVDWVRGGYIDGTISICPTCDGSGEVEEEEEDDDEEEEDDDEEDDD